MINKNNVSIRSFRKSERSFDLNVEASLEIENEYIVSTLCNKIANTKEFYSFLKKTTKNLLSECVKEKLTSVDGFITNKIDSFFAQNLVAQTDRAINTYMQKKINHRIEQLVNELKCFDNIEKAIDHLRVALIKP